MPAGINAKKMKLYLTLSLVRAEINGSYKAKRISLKPFIIEPKLINTKIGIIRIPRLPSKKAVAKEKANEDQSRRSSLETEGTREYPEIK